MVAEAAENEMKNLEFMTTWDQRGAVMSEKSAPMEMKIEKLKKKIVNLEETTKEEICDSMWEA